MKLSQIRLGAIYEENQHRVGQRSRGGKAIAIDEQGWVKLQNTEEVFSLPASALCPGSSLPSFPNMQQQANTALPYGLLVIFFILSVMSNTWLLFFYHLLLGQIYCTSMGLHPPSSLGPPAKRWAYTAYYQLWWPYYLWQRIH